MLRKIRKMLQQQEGFTLVELMIVVVILGIISGIGIQQYGKVQTKARVEAHNANVRIVEGAANMHILVEDDPTIAANTPVMDKLSAYLQTEPLPEYNYGSTRQFTIGISQPEGSDGYVVKVSPGRVDADGKEIEQVGS